jgi:hypothetical protein
MSYSFVRRVFGAACSVDKLIASFREADVTKEGTLLSIKFGFECTNFIYHY